MPRWTDDERFQWADIQRDEARIAQAVRQMEPATIPPKRCPICDELCAAGDWHFDGIQRWPGISDEHDVWSSKCCWGTVNVLRPQTAREVNEPTT